MAKYVKSIKFSTSGETYTIRDAEQKARLDTLEPKVTSVETALGGKQDTLVSGTNIKTINGNNILGSGNLVIEGGSGGTPDYEQLENKPQIDGKELNKNSTAESLGLATTSSLEGKQDVIDSTHKLDVNLVDGAATTTALETKADVSALTAHTENSDIHVTASKKTEWDAKQDKLTSANAGDNVTITEVGGVVKINSTGGSGGSTSFANLTGNPEDNDALKDALDAKANEATTLAGYGITDAYTKTEADSEFLSSTDLGSENAGKFIKVANDGSATFGNPTCDPQDIADAVDDYMAEHPISGDSFTDNDIPLIKLEDAVYHHSTNIWDVESSEYPVSRGVNLTDTPEGCLTNFQGYLSGGVWYTTNTYATGATDNPASWQGRLFGYAPTDYIKIPESGKIRCNFPVRNLDTYKEIVVQEYTYVQQPGQRACPASNCAGAYSTAIAAGTVIDLTSYVANGAKYVRLATYEAPGAAYVSSSDIENGTKLVYVSDSEDEVEGGEPYYEDYTTLPGSCIDSTDILNESKSYADTQDTAILNTAKGYADAQDTATLALANTYTDEHLPDEQTLESINDLIVHDDHHSNNILNPENFQTYTPEALQNFIGYNSTVGTTYDEDQSDPDTAYNADHRYRTRAPYCTHAEAISHGYSYATSASSAMPNYGCSGSYYVGDLDLPGHWISLNVSVRFWKFTDAKFELDSAHKNVRGFNYYALIGSGNNALNANVWYYIPEDFDIETYCYMDFGANGAGVQESWPQFGGSTYICMRIAPGNLTRAEVEQITPTVLPNDEYYDIKNVWLNVDMIQDGSLESEKFNLQEVAEAVPTYIGEHTFPANKLEICETHKPSNLVVPGSMTHNTEQGWFLSGNVWSSNFQTYFVGDFIPVEGIASIKQNVQARTIAFYYTNREYTYTYNPEDGKQVSADYISYKSTQTNAGTEVTVPNGAKYMRCSYYESDRSIVESNLYVADAELYDESDAQWYPSYETIKSEYLPDSPSPTPTPGGSTYETITIANSDKIMFIGDSYTEASHSIENKAYPAKLSMFSDYEFENMAMSGDIYFGQLDKIRTNYTRWGTSFLKCNPKYAIMTCWTNDIKTLNVNQYAEGLRSCCKQVISLGAQPLISTEYHAGGATAQVPTINDQIARELGCPNWNYAKLVRLIRGSDYAPFWGGSHPGPRTNAIESDNMEKYLNTLERPRKSLKFFRLRDFMDFDPTGDMTNLVYWNNEERAEKFKEIHVSHSVIQDPTMVDNITSASTTGQTSEYAIMQDGGNCTFHRAGIMDVVIPGTYKTTSDMYIKLGTNGANFKCYVLDSLAGSYTRPVYMLRVDLVSSLCTNVPAVDDVYDMTPQIGGTQTRLTVKQIVYGIGDAGADMTLFCYLNGSPVSYATSVPDSPGTLTKVSGQGDDTVAYTYRAKSYNTDSINDIIVGGWTELEAVEDHGRLLFTLDNTKLKQYIHRDKVSFLFTNADSEGTNTDFYINHPEVYWAGKDDKLYQRGQLNFISNYDNSNTELLDHTTFGTAGTLDPNFNVTPIAVYDNCYPVDCSSAAVINDSDKITITLSSAACTALKCAGNTNPANLTTTEAILEVWARYFPDIYTDGSGNQITGDSYDYAKLYFDMVATNEYYTATMSERVNTHWKIVQFPIHVSGIWADPKIRLWSNKDLQIAKISLKLQEVTRTHS